MSPHSVWSLLQNSTVSFGKKAKIKTLFSKELNNLTISHTSSCRYSCLVSKKCVAIVGVEVQDRKGFSVDTKKAMKRIQESHFSQMAGKTEAPLPKRKKPETTVFKFKKIWKSGCYVDKTGIIKTYLNDVRKIVVTAPSSFGKSTIMDMMKTFFQMEMYENNKPITYTQHAVYHKKRSIFEKFEIGMEKDLMDEHLGKYAVVHMDFRVHLKTTKSAEVTTHHLNDAFRGVVAELFQTRYAFLARSRTLSADQLILFGKYVRDDYYDGTVDVPLKFLCGCLSQHFNGAPVFLFIDEIDALVTQCLYQESFPVEQLQDVVNFVSQLLGLLCKGDTADRVFLTGRNDYGGLLTAHANNVNFVHSDYGRYYGFTLNETKNLCLSAGVEFDEEKLTSWYGGFSTTIRSTGETISLFNPWSVLNYISNSTVYWPYSFVDNLGKLLFHPEIIERIWSEDEHSVTELKDKMTIKDFLKLHSLMFKQSEFPDTSHLTAADFHLIYFLMMQAGFLSYKNGISKLESTSFFPIKIKVPNLENLQVLQECILKYSWNKNKDIMAYANIFNECMQRFMLGTDSDQSITFFLFRLFEALKGSNYVFKNEASCRHALATALRDKFDDVHIEIGLEQELMNIIQLKSRNTLIQVKFTESDEEVADGVKTAFKDIREKSYWKILKTDKKRYFLGILVSEDAKKIRIAGFALDVEQDLEENF